MTPADSFSALSRGRRSQLNVPYRMFRRLERGEPLTVSHLGAQIRVEVGDHLDAALLPQIASMDRRRLAAAVPSAEIEEARGIQIDASQVVVRGVGSSDSSSMPVNTRTPAEVSWAAEEKHPADVDFHCHAVIDGPVARVALSRITAFAADGTIPVGALCLVARECLTFARASPVAALAETMHRAARAHPDVDAFFAVGNRTAPFDLPMAGESSPSSTSRLPGGWSAREVAGVLAPCSDVPVILGAMPAHVSAVALTREGARRVSAAADGRGLLPLRVATVPTAHVWDAPDADGAPPEWLRAAMGTHRPDMARSLDSAVRQWPNVAETLRRRVVNAPAPCLPVCFWTTAIGPWGGVGVLYQLAKRLNDRGFHAFVAYKYDQAEHSYHTDCSPLKVRNPAQFASEWRAMAGDSSGIFVAGNWTSGAIAADVARKNPGVALTTFLQDREDLFEQPDGGKPSMGRFAEYLRIGHGVAVARWVVDSARKDLGLAGDYEVIPSGIDTGIFYPPPMGADGHGGAASGRSDGTGTSGPPVRILAMWRPATDVRRGIRRLREVYDRLHAQFGAGVSLELFGWNDHAGVGRAPDYARHHGKLTPRQVADLMRAVDVVVEPSEYQGWGCSPAEGMACGCAVASTACFGPADFIRPGANGLMVPHSELDHAVSELIRDPSLRATLGAAAAADAWRYSMDRVADLWAVRLAALWRERGNGRHGDAVAEIAQRAADRLSARAAVVGE